LTVDGEPAQLGAADLDGDGDADAVLRTEGPGHGLHVLWNNGAAPWTAVYLQTGLHPFALGDIDADGDVDVLAGQPLVNLARQLHIPARVAVGATLRAQLFDWSGGLAVPALAPSGLEPRLRLCPWVGSASTPRRRSCCRRCRSPRATLRCSSCRCRAMSRCAAGRCTCRRFT
jgi:hypothetical protein